MAQIFIFQITILSKTSGDLRHNLGLWTIILICNGIKYILIHSSYESVILGHSKKYSYTVQLVILKNRL